MIYGSVCSGIEAATAAWHPLGWQARFFAEINPAPCYVLGHHYGASRPIYMPDPDEAGITATEARERINAIRAVRLLPDADKAAIINYGDFTKIKENEHEPVDLLVGGTPCQSFSVAGLRNGLDDERGNLALEFLKTARRTRARWLVWENVPGCLSSNGGRDFGAIIGGMVELGYGIAYRILDAQYFGVPQRRRRVFVVGYFGDWRPAAAVLFERESLRWNPTPSRKKGEGVAPTISARTKGGGGLGTDFDCDGGLVAKALRSRHSSSHREDSDTFIAHTLTGEGFDASYTGTGGGVPLVPDVAWALQERDYKGQDSNTKEGHLIPVYHTINSQIATRHNKTGERTGMGIGTNDASPTIGANHHHAVAIPIQDKATRYKGGGDTRNDDGAANGFGVGQDGDPFPTLGAHDVHAVAFDMAQITSKTNRSTVSEKAPVPTLSSNSDMHVASFKPGQSAESRGIGYEENVAPSLEAGGGGNNQPAVMAGMAVRRLIPRECERLQGFKDDYTLVMFGKKIMADGPRYKMLGNSMAVPVMHWIGKRIDKVEKIINGV